MKLSIHETSDAEAISRMAHLIWMEHYPSIIGREQTAYMLRELYNAQNLQLQMMQGQRFFFLMMDDDAVGFVSFTRKEPRYYFLNKWYILPGHQGKKLGEQTFGLLLNHMPDAEVLRLTVNRQNYKAINFYFKLGFRIEEVKDFDIGNGYFMNDFIMIYRTGPGTRA